MKRARLCVDVDDVNEFFDEVKKAFVGVGDVKAENVYNYDETNFTNDPGKSWVIVRRGRKRVEKVREASKPEENVDDDIEWVGCDTCPRWYHRICLCKMDINATSCIVCVVPEVSDYSSSEDEEIEVV